MKKYLLIGMAALLTACSPEVTSSKMKTITDNVTRPEIELVEPLENSLLVEWYHDNMDRGNHDYETSDHPRLVVGLDYKDVKRGDVIYFKSPDFTIESNPDFNMPEHYIARVVGLESETVEIVNGQLFIDGKKLDTFYSKVLSRGKNEEEFFKESNPTNKSDNDFWKEYFATTIEPVKVEANTVFVLGDNWWRSTDSKDFGVLPMDNVEGKVIGYVKK